MNYRPTQRQLLRDVFGVEPPPDVDWKPETYRDYAAPTVRVDSTGARESIVATFSMVPRARIVDSTPAGTKAKNFDTINARAETVGEKRSFSGAWKAGQLCLVPATAVYEPNYEAEPAKSIRYRIWVRDEPAFAVAGLWRAWPDGAYSKAAPAADLFGVADA
ncbi:SOS response-associated peptidase family protein [Cupriavidus plantarum]